MLLDDLQIVLPLEAPQGVEVTRREAGGRSYIFALNHNAFEVQVPMAFRMRDLLTGKIHKHTLTLPPHEVAILEG